MLREKCLLQSEILCVKTWHAMCFRENDNVGSKWDVMLSMFFIDVNSILYAVNNIYPTTEDSRLCKAQMSNRSKDREIELINKEGWSKRK